MQSVICEHWLPPPLSCPAPSLMTLAEAAAFLRVSEFAVRRYVRESELRPTRVGRCNHYQLKECLRFIQERQGLR